MAARPRNRRVVNDACLYCHSDFVHPILAFDDPQGDPANCVRCHTAVGHALNQ